MTKTLSGNKIETGDFVCFFGTWVKLTQRRSLPVDRRVQQFVAEDRQGTAKIINLKWTEEFQVWTRREV
jgi:hypothetical protein